jgi:hypothetical protein
MHKFISIGGWCGTTISLRGNNLYEQALPFDNIRSTFAGIIDCFETNFQNFFPKKLEVDIIENYSYSGLSFRGKYFGFYHHNLLDPKIINDFYRRIERLNNILNNQTTNTIFIRTITKQDYEEETLLIDKFLNIIDIKYPNLNYIVVFIVPGQNNSIYYRHINHRTFIFTLNDNSCKNENLPMEYKPIYDFILTEDLFKNIPKSNNDILIQKNNNRYVSFSGVDTFRLDN